MDEVDFKRENAEWSVSEGTKEDAASSGEGHQQATEDIHIYLALRFTSDFTRINPVR